MRATTGFGAWNRAVTDRVFNRTYTVGHIRAVEYWIDRQIAGGDRLLEFGCGCRFFLSRILQQRFTEVHATDVEEATPPEGVTFRRCTTDRVPFPDDFFDVIVIRSVVEHLPDPTQTFRELARVLRPGGTIVFNLPNRWDYVSVAAAAAGRFKHAALRFTKDSTWKDFPVFYRANTRRAFRRVAADAGLTIEIFRPLPSEPSYLAGFAPLYIIGTLYQFVISFLALDFLQPAFLVRVVKPPRQADSRG